MRLAAGTRWLRPFAPREWLQGIDGGVAAVRRDPVWSPPGWFDADEFAATAHAITLNAHRARWVQGEEVDSRYGSMRRTCAPQERRH